MRILFVCMGNICRSPTAEAVMRALLDERGIDIDVDSAGTGAWHAGSAPDRRATAAAAARGYRLSGRARQVRRADFDDFDVIVAMDADNLRDLAELAPRAAVSKLRLLPSGEVPDPYYGGPDGFDLVLDIVVDGCSRLLDELVVAGPVSSSE
jgi:protein-tyrosine phosphatase